MEAWFTIEDANWEEEFEKYESNLGDEIGSSMIKSNQEEVLFDVFIDELVNIIGHKLRQFNDDVEINLWHYYSSDD